MHIGRQNIDRQMLGNKMKDRKINVGRQTIYTYIDRYIGGRQKYKDRWREIRRDNFTLKLIIQVSYINRGIDRQIDRYIYQKIYRQTDRWIDRQIDRQKNTYRQINRQIGGNKNSHINIISH